jgi:hypothetical protein
MEMWRRHGEAASAAAPYSAHHGLYSEAVVSSVASAVALAEVGQFREAVQYVQRVAKALYEAARDVFERVKMTVQRLVELFVEAVARVLAWIDEHKAYLFLMAAVAAGAVALAAALNLWGLVELDKLAYAASLTPFIPGGVKEYSREEVFKILREAPDPYEKFREIAKVANAGRVKLAEPWESLRVLIMPKRSEEERLMRGKGAGLYSKSQTHAEYYNTQTSRRGHEFQPTATSGMCPSATVLHLSPRLSQSSPACRGDGPRRADAFQPLPPPSPPPQVLA